MGQRADRLVGVTALTALAALVVTAGPAWAGPVDDAVAGLRAGPVFVDPAAGREVDVAAVRDRIGDRPILIAILPAGPGTGEVRTWPREISALLPGNTVAVISGRYFYAGSDVLCKGVAGQAATTVIARHNADLDQEANSDLTAALTDFVAELAAAPRCEAGPAARGDRYADEPGGGEASAVDDTATVLPIVAGGLTAGVLGVGTWVLLARRRAAAAARRGRDETRALVARLGQELDGLPDRNDPTTQRAVWAAAAKHAEAQALLLGATTDVQYAAVRQAATEGLAAARGAVANSVEPSGTSAP